MSVKRYTYQYPNSMFGSESGEWVKYADHISELKAATSGNSQSKPCFQCKSTDYKIICADCGHVKDEHVTFTGGV